MIQGMEGILKEHPFFAGLQDSYRELISGCAKNAHFGPGEYLFHDGETADWFYLIRQGKAAFQLAAPGRKEVVFQTVGEGELAGVSWLIPPYRWTYDARALEAIRAIAVNAGCLRDKCEADHDLGYDMMKRFMPVLIGRLQATRLQILDVYGTHG